MVASGIVGVPNAGKSTLFCALSRAAAEVSTYPFCTIEANRAVVPVPDPRLDELGEIFGQESRIPTAIEFTDIAGLVRGAHQGHGLGNRFLGHIREADAILHVVRCFDRPDVPHVDGSVDAVRDVEVVNTELMLADLETVERRRQKAKRGMSLEEIQLQDAALAKLEAVLRDGRPASSVFMDAEEREVAAELFLLTMKPVLYVANVDEADMLTEGPELARLRGWAQPNGHQVIPIAARLEAEVAELAEDDATDFVEEYGLPELGLGRVVEAAYRLLDLITFFTAVGKECRAWTLKRGSTALEAAGKIHTDMAKGFQKAEVLSFDELARIGSWPEAKEKGHVRSEGREYVVQDGDVMLFRFST
jgi:hypothetical protein